MKAAIKESSRIINVKQTAKFIKYIRTVVLNEFLQASGNVGLEHLTLVSTS